MASVLLTSVSDSVVAALDAVQQAEEDYQATLTAKATADAALVDAQGSVSQRAGAVDLAAKSLLAAKADFFKVYSVALPDPK